MENKQMLAEQFRREVRDKLAVVYHGATNPHRTTREILLKQCEDFLVEQFESALLSAIEEEPLDV